MIANTHNKESIDSEVDYCLGTRVSSFLVQFPSEGRPNTYSIFYALPRHSSQYFQDFLSDAKQDFRFRRSKLYRTNIYLYERCCP